MGGAVVVVAEVGFQFWSGKRQEILGFLPVLVIVAAVIHFVLPHLETAGIDPADPDGPLTANGLAVRGYGFFLLLAMLSGIGLALYRCYQIGFDGEKILSLTFWMVVAGVIGARLFYVVQKFDSFSALNGRDLAFKLLDMTSGGLVVYGSLFGGVVAAALFVKLNGLSWRRVADILAPGMALGLAIGRIGCLMNGCCYGGVCDESFPGVYFPAASPPYVHQLRSGALFGIEGRYDENENAVTVDSVQPGGIADQNEIIGGDLVQIFLSHPQQDDINARLRAAKQGAAIDVEAIVVVDDDDRSFRVPVRQLPDRSLRTHPTQIYSSINAALLCALLWFYYPCRRKDGDVFALLLILYSIGRFLLEIIRRDEGGQFGTSLTISQWISIAALIAGIVLWVWPGGTADDRSGRG